MSRRQSVSRRQSMSRKQGSEATGCRLCNKLGAEYTKKAE